MSPPLSPPLLPSPPQNKLGPEWRKDGASHRGRRKRKTPGKRIPSAGAKAASSPAEVWGRRRGGAYRKEGTPHLRPADCQKGVLGDCSRASTRLRKEGLRAEPRYGSHLGEDQKNRLGNRVYPGLSRPLQNAELQEQAKQLRPQHTSGQ